jgi:hypothetical protein
MEDFEIGVAAARGTGDVVELGRRLEFDFEVKLAWGRCTRAYIGVWKQSERIKI